MKNININGYNYIEITTEACKDVIEGKYYINIKGDVYDIEQSRFLTIRIGDNGYYFVSLKIRNNLYRICLLHRLLMITFNYIPEYQYMQVDHIDCNKLNINFTNLEWVTLEENTFRANNNGLILRGEDCPWSILDENKVKEICQLISSKQYTITEIANKYNVSVTTIGDIARGKQWTHISKNYNLDYDVRDKFSDQEVHIICKIFETYHSRFSLDYMYYLILFYFGWPEERRIKKRIARIFYKDPKSYAYITKDYNY